MMKTIFTSLLWVCTLIGVYAIPNFDDVATVHDEAVSCANAINISCNKRLTNQSNSTGQHIISSFDCSNSVYDNYGGKELIYEFTLDYTSQVDIRLSDITGEGVNFDMFLFRGSCQAGSCTRASTNPGKSSENITAELPAGTYYVSSSDLKLIVLRRLRSNADHNIRVLPGVSAIVLMTCFTDVLRRRTVMMEVINYSRSIKKVIQTDFKFTYTQLIQMSIYF
jgi:hypothetical protein